MVRLVIRSWYARYMLLSTSYKLFVLMVVTFANREIRHDGNEQYFFIY
ncbi:hypothetical protein [Vibrio gallaecicus]|nr:hypothetical protein [Vibrio gallaecicus]MDN3615063.1 hypothetical protein [Vibrio gallaecicus]